MAKLMKIIKIGALSIVIATGSFFSVNTLSAEKPAVMDELINPILKTKAYVPVVEIALAAKEIEDLLEAMEETEGQGVSVERFEKLAEELVGFMGQDESVTQELLDGYLGVDAKEVSELTKLIQASDPKVYIDEVVTKKDWKRFRPLAKDIITMVSGVSGDTTDRFKRLFKKKYGLDLDSVFEGKVDEAF